MYVAFCIGDKIVNFGIGERAARNRDIGENALFTMVKREIPRGFSLLGVQSQLKI
jgi:hypothetical protein